jgi:hypothetical protein
VAIVLRLALALSTPMLSSDIYRYVWDGEVQNAGISPYLHVPADPALAGLRTDAIFPHINRADYAPTIYPPAAQAIFAAVASVSPGVVAMKLAMLGFEAVTIFTLLRLLAASGQSASRVLIYAWNPLALWEVAGNGHIDAAAVGLIFAALLLQVRRPGWAGVALGAAVLTKFLPAVVIPALWRRGVAGWRMVAAGVVCIVAFYGVYCTFDSAGWHVLGFLGGYGAEEGIDNGSGIWALAGLATLVDLPHWAAPLYLGVVAVGLAGLGAWIGLRRRPPLGSALAVRRMCGDAGILAAALMLAVSPHYAWYYVWLSAFAAITPYRALIWLSSAAVLLYESPFPDHFHWPALLFLPALAFAWRDVQSARAPSPTRALQGSF